MRTNNRFRISGRRATLVRGLICVLLSGIVYSATFGVVHSHGNISSDFGSHRAAGTAGQDTTLSTIRFHSHSNGKDCLICLLHRQFSSTIIHAHFFEWSIPLVEFVSPVIQYRAVSVAFQPIARPSGRAPPLVMPTR